MVSLYSVVVTVNIVAVIVTRIGVGVSWKEGMEMVPRSIIEPGCKSWNRVIMEGLKACGYLEQQEIRSVVVKPCECGD